MSTTKATVPGGFFAHVHNALLICDPNSERPRATLRKVLRELQAAEAIMANVVRRARAEDSSDVPDMVH
jgi:hypothetical protein